MVRRLGVVVLVAALTCSACARASAPAREAAADVASSVAAPVVTFERIGYGAATYDVEASLPVVTGVDPAVAHAVERHARAWFDEVAATFARDDLEFLGTDPASEAFPPGWLEVRADVGAVNPVLLSVVFTVTSMHQGMAHPWTVVEAFTYDLATGGTVELADLFAPGQDVLGTVSAQVVPLLRTKLDPGGEGWAEAGILEGAGPDLHLLHRFVLEESGLTIHFDQYQVAPGAAGQQAVTLGWEGLLDLLEPSPLLQRALAG